MDLITDSNHQTRIYLATLGLTEGYIPVSTYDEMLGTYSELEPKILIAALSNKLANIDDMLLHRIIHLVGKRLVGFEHIAGIRITLDSLGKKNAQRIVDSYISPTD